MRKHIYFITAIFVICHSSCEKNKRKEDAVKVVQEWIGKEIRFPENVPCFVSGVETFSDACTDFFHKEFKILLYVDSTGCSSCRMRLFDWKQLIEEAERLYPGKVGFLFFFQPKLIKDIDFLFVRDRFEYPVFMDTGSEINCLNRFPQVELFQCFLLDGDNKVLSIGNPTMNPKIWDLFKSQIEGTRLSEPKILTTIQVEKTTHDYGTIHKGSTNYTDFEITNTGSNPLVISRISVACGCTRATWDRQPIAPAKTTTIRVEMTPDITGSFNRTVAVYCNTDEAPTKLTVTGMTIE